MTSLRQSAVALIDAPPAVSVGPARFGLGVFAQRPIVEDEIIGEVTGEIIHKVGYGSEYCIDLDARRVLEPAEPFRYVNHSCDPNCEIFSWDEEEDGVTPDQVFLVALRVIQSGEELSIDYAWEADAAIPCGCGASKCRGWIVDEAELADVLRRERGAESKAKKNGTAALLKPAAAKQRASRPDSGEAAPASDRSPPPASRSPSPATSSPDRASRKRRPRG